VQDLGVLMAGHGLVGGTLKVAGALGKGTISLAKTAKSAGKAGAETLAKANPLKPLRTAMTPEGIPFNLADDLAGDAARTGARAEAKAATKTGTNFANMADDVRTKPNTGTKMEAGLGEGVGGKVDDAVKPVVNEPVHNVPENVVGQEALKTELRAGMKRPIVQDPKLFDIMEELYTDHPNKVGSGSTAAAFREELVTGKPVGGKFHDMKVEQRITNLKGWIRDNPIAMPGDRAAAENVLKDLQNALKGGDK